MAEKKCIFFIIFVWNVYKLFDCLLLLWFNENVVLLIRLWCIFLFINIRIWQIIINILLAGVRNTTWHINISFFKRLIAPLWYLVIFNKMFSCFHPSTKSWFTHVLLGCIQRPLFFSHCLSILRNIFAVWHELRWVISRFWSWSIGHRFWRLII